MKKEKIIIILLSLALIFVVSVGAYSFINGGFNNPNEPNVISGYETAVNEITEIDYSKRQEELDQIVEEGMMNVQYAMYASFDGKVSKSFNVKNIKNNKHPIVFSLYDENGDLIYESKRIDLGYELNSIELNKELSKGTHECSIKIGYAEEGNVSSVFPITIEVS